MHALGMSVVNHLPSLPLLNSSNKSAAAISGKNFFIKMSTMAMSVSVVLLSHKCAYITFHFREHIWIHFSTPEHKVLRVSYCERPLSVVRRRVASVVRRATCVNFFYLNIFSSETARSLDFD